MSCKIWRRYDSYQGNLLDSLGLLFQVSNGIYIPSFLNKRLIRQYLYKVRGDSLRITISCRSFAILCFSDLYSGITLIIHEKSPKLPVFLIFLFVIFLASHSKLCCYTISEGNMYMLVTDISYVHIQVAFVF